MVGGLGGRVTRSPARSIILALCLSATALAASAADTLRPALSLSAGGTLRPGQAVAVGWPPLPAGTEEFELLLRYESPLTLTVRLTDSKEPALTSLAWRVPGLPEGRARLLMRVGRRHAEREWALSPPFRIARDLLSPPQRVTLRRGELWVQDGPTPASTSLAATDRHLWGAPGGLPSPAGGPTDSGALTTPKGHLARRHSPVRHARAAACPPFTRTPLRRVLRL